MVDCQTRKTYHPTGKNIPEHESRGLYFFSEYLKMVVGIESLCTYDDFCVTRIKHIIHSVPVGYLRGWHFAYM